MTAARPLQDGIPPPWADSWGEDVYGVWAGFVVGEVEHRLRFIPGGTYVMGSPPTELGHLARTEEQKEVTVHDLWMGETPVSQALYASVMGHNPSYFQSEAVPWLCADRPVEGVSPRDARAFMEKLNRERPELGLSLPHEAAWEYACRAGTTTATYAGDLDDSIRSAVLDRIACYRANAGDSFDLVGFKLADGDEVNEGPSRVGQLAPNGWGLYDMLGNVVELCEAETEAGSIARGGSWSSSAEGCRAASRFGLVPDSLRGYRGFRVFRSG